jgi:hypothetical protein
MVDSTSQIFTRFQRQPHFLDMNKSTLVLIIGAVLIGVNIVSITLQLPWYLQPISTLRVAAQVVEDVVVSLGAMAGRFYVQLVEHLGPAVRTTFEDVLYLGTEAIRLVQRYWQGVFQTCSQAYVYLKPHLLTWIMWATVCTCVAVFLGILYYFRNPIGVFFAKFDGDKQQQEQMPQHHDQHDTPINPAATRTRRSKND